MSVDSLGVTGLGLPITAGTFGVPFYKVSPYTFSEGDETERRMKSTGGVEKKISVLIVDDDSGITDTLEDIFEDSGYDVATAGDGFEAIEKVKGDSYDVALLDIKMPGMNGIETQRKIKKISPSTRVILMTAYSVLDLVKDGLKEGAVGIFHKPLDIDKVLDFVGSIGRGCLILIVDDDSDTCKGMKDVLEEKNHTVSCAKNGGEAVMIARNEPVDIAFINLKVSELNGLKTFLAVKEANPGITAIMMTGHRDETKGSVEEAIKKGARTCLYKPLDMEEISSIVDTIYQEKRE